MARGSRKHRRAPDPVISARISLYNADFDELAHNYTLLGANDGHLAIFFGVSKNTISNWKRDYPSFRTAIATAGDIADAKVAKSLYGRACGYNITTVREESGNNANGAFAKTVETTVHIPGDVSAAIHWLSARGRRKPHMDSIWVKPTEEPGGVVRVEIVGGLPDPPATDR